MDQDDSIIVKEQDTVSSTKGVKKQITIAGNIPILYMDAAYIATKPWGIVIDFAQDMGPTNRQNIVSRMGMSTTQAKLLIESLQKAVESIDNKSKQHDKQ